MSKYWNERVRKLEPYVPGEQPRNRKFIKLNTNENPYPPSPNVIEAIRRAAGDSLRLYPDPSCTELREAVAARYGVTVDQVFPGNGSDEALAFAFAAFFATPEDGANAPPALFPDITYSFYPVYARLWNAPFETAPLADDFSINVNDYLRPSGGIILANPNAPTGLALPLEELRRLIEYQKEQGKVMVVDEAYGAFAAGNKTLSAVPLTARYPNLLTVHTLSKSASLAGLRVGFAIGSEELIQGLCRVRDSFNSYTLDRLALAGAAAAIADVNYYDELSRRIIATRERVSVELRGMGFLVIPSSANFIFISLPGKPGAEAFAALRERGILTRHFNTPRISDYLRVSIGTDGEMDRFLEACRALAEGPRVIPSSQSTRHF
ncbi:MAG: histidinol-phosphate transaminase [Treponema sp.]|jgi:histidinol-phosphate aminotransferase|nr:histidinol-phosphate transaminase [Treponema sp.]